MNLPFAYCSRKSLAPAADGSARYKGYWRFRHPKTGDVPLPGTPESHVFIWRYKQLLAQSGAKAKVRMTRVNAIRTAAGEHEFFEVYFIQSGDGGPIKIGYSTNVAVRLADLQTASPHDLTLLASLPGGPKLEKVIHRGFDEHRIKGEWFRPAEDLLTFIEEVRIGAFARPESHSNEEETGLPCGKARETVLSR